MGDLGENGDYHAAKDEQGHMEGRIRGLEHILETAEIIAGAAGIMSGLAASSPSSTTATDDQAERYLVGHIEEHVGDLDVISPPLRSAPR